MNLNMLIVDNFYADPMSVRNFALQQEFNCHGNFPGIRTKSFMTDDVKKAIEHYMQFAGKITNLYEETGHTGAFQLATSTDRTWIHCDHFNMWAGVCYLTPDAPHTSGTGLFRHKATGHYRREGQNYEAYDYTKYDLFDVVGNKFNRLVIYRGDLFHASLDYFGDNLQNGRLFQVFFFDTEKF